MANKGFHTHCCYCRRKFSDTVELLKKTIDHFWPSSRTGHNVPENKLQCCLECNRWKADKMPGDWLKVAQWFFDRRVKFGTYTRTDFAQIIGSLKHFLKSKKDQNISDYKL
jgi:HNH endonuclease